MKSRCSAWMASLFTFCFLLSGCGNAKLFPSPFTLTPSATLTRTLTHTPTFTSTSTFTPTLTSTATPVPIKDRDLSAVILQKTEIPDYYNEEEGYSGPDCMGAIYPEYVAVHEDLVNGFNRTYLSIADISFYSSSVFVYTDEKAAKKAYRKIVEEWTGDVVKIPVIGSESYANLTVDINYGMYLMDIAWRDDETVLEIAYFAVRKPDADGMVKLAQGIQHRLEQPVSLPKTNPSPIGGGSGKIAFISNGKIDMVNTDGSGLTCIVNHHASSIAFSPDGQKIAFTSSILSCRDIGDKKAICDNTSEIYIAKKDGSNLILLVENNAQTPVWSPDGKKIIYQITKKEPYSNNVIIYLNLSNSDGSDQKELGSLWFGNFAWSPDGKKITYTCYENKKENVCTMNSDGSGLAYLTSDTYNQFIQYSPDGKKILFISYREEEKNGLYIMDADGGNTVKLIRKNEVMTDPNWSPKGEEIAYVYYYHTDIYSIKTDGSGDTQLTNNLGRDVCPVWSPDGTKILFITQRNGPRELFLMNDDGSDQKYLVTMAGERDFCPVWIPA